MRTDEKTIAVSLPDWTWREITDRLRDAEQEYELSAAGVRIGALCRMLEEAFLLTLSTGPSPGLRKIARKIVDRRKR